MPHFVVICRAHLQPNVIRELENQAIYDGQGAPIHPSSPDLRRHYLVVEADDDASALSNAQSAVTTAGGDASDIEVVSNDEP
jgi:hypothetical protein